MASQENLVWDFALFNYSGNMKIHLHILSSIESKGFWKFHHYLLMRSWLCLKTNWYLRETETESKSEIFRAFHRYSYQELIIKGYLLSMMNVNAAVSFFGKTWVETIIGYSTDIGEIMLNTRFFMYFYKYLVLKLQITCILNRAGNYSYHV